VHWQNSRARRQNHRLVHRSLISVLLSFTLKSHGRHRNADKVEISPSAPCIFKL
jgi:hypothetical protein